MDGGSSPEPVEVCATPQPGCACGEAGALTGCYTGPADTENVGACRAGTMVCVVQFEFGLWTACEGQVTPGVDVPGDGIDQDCDGADATEPCMPSGLEDCTNGRDDDCDGLTDCSDTIDCRCPGPCRAEEFGEICGDGRDNDCDGLADCDDTEDCRCTGGCVPESWGELCWDRRDNDCDGLADCDDTADCPCMPSCTPSPEACGDGRDNDCDMRVDCDDSDCPCEPACTPSPEDCGDGRDNDCDTLVDCDDSSCSCPTPAPERLYAHTGGVLYSVDPTTWTVSTVGSFGITPLVTDLAIDNAGAMYAIAGTGLYSVDPTVGRATFIGETGVTGANALTFLADGRLFMAGERTLYEVNVGSGSARRVGDFGGSVRSSGDLSGSPDGNLYLTAVGDSLVRVNPATGATTAVGSLGRTGVLGLAYWSGAMYGFTSGGRVIRIDLRTGAATEVSSPGQRFFGAAVNQRLWD